MKVATEYVDEFEYKGKKFTVRKDGTLKYYFVYEEKGKKIHLSFDELKEFMNSPFSHTTINNNPIDIIEKSLKINDFLFDFKDLKQKIEKYN